MAPEALKIPTKALLVILAGAFLTYWHCRDYAYVGRFHDDAYYWIGAQSLLQGSFKNLAHPVQPPMAHILPGYPLLLAPIIRLNHNNFFAAKLQMILFLTASLGFMALLWRQHLKAAHLLFMLSAMAFNPYSLARCGALLSDMPFLCLSLAAAVCLQSLGAYQCLGKLLLLCGLAGFSAWVRAEGIILILVLFFSLWRHYQMKQAAWIFLGITSLMACLPYLRNIEISGLPIAQLSEIGNGSLAQQTAAVAAAFIENLGNLSNVLFWQGLAGLPDWGPAAGGCAVHAQGAAAGALILMLIGYRSRKKPSPLDRFCLLYPTLFAGLHLLWVNQDVRYFVPILPFLYYFLALGWQTIETALGSKTQILMWGCLAGMLFSDIVIIKDAQRPRPGENRPPFQTIAWLKKNSAPDDVLVGATPATMYLYTQRRCLDARTRAGKSGEFWLKKLLAYKVRYAWLDHSLEPVAMVAQRRQKITQELTAFQNNLNNSRWFQRVYANQQEAHEIFALNAYSGR